jgi:hypothetical protein
MAIDCSLVFGSEKRRRILLALAAFPALLEKDFCSFRAPGVSFTCLVNAARQYALRHLLVDYWDRFSKGN